MSEEPDRSVAGDNDTWMLLERLTADGYPLVVLTRTGNPLIALALRDSFLTVVECQADPGLVRDNGMPEHTDRIYPVEEELAQNLASLDVGALHVASVTGDGSRRIVIAHELPLDFTPVLSRFQIEGYSLTELVADDRYEWTQIVMPTEVEYWLNGDQSLISNIERSGDDGVVPRKTDFWFYGDLQALTALAAELAGHGYSIDHWTEEACGFILTIETPVDFDAFRAITPMLVDAAARHGVSYDGWETFVVRPETERPQATKPTSLLNKLFKGTKN